MHISITPISNTSWAWSLKPISIHVSNILSTSLMNINLSIQRISLLSRNWSRNSKPEESKTELKQPRSSENLFELIRDLESMFTPRYNLYISLNNQKMIVAHKIIASYNSTNSLWLHMSTIIFCKNGTKSMTNLIPWITRFLKISTFKILESRVTKILMWMNICAYLEILPINQKKQRGLYNIKTFRFEEN